MRPYMVCFSLPNLKFGLNERDFAALRSLSNKFFPKTIFISLRMDLPLNRAAELPASFASLFTILKGNRDFFRRSS